MAASPQCEPAPDAVRPPPGSPLSLISWARELAIAAWWILRPPPFPTGPLPRGHGQTVLLIPGFLGGDWAMGRLRGFLTRLGYRVEMAGIAFNTGPTARRIAGLEARLTDLAERDGPIFVIGQSLGGVFARHLARRYPEAVRGVVTLCTPIQFPVVTPLYLFAALLAPLHDPVWRAARDQIAAPLTVPLTAIYSRTDGIVDWRQCLQPDGAAHEDIRVDGIHTAIGSNPAAQRAVAEALAKNATS
jgi:pimeloyl-ACP methyl ester carboxylesterase